MTVKRAQGKCQGGGGALLLKCSIATAHRFALYNTNTQVVRIFPNAHIKHMADSAGVRRDPEREVVSRGTN